MKIKYRIQLFNFIFYFRGIHFFPAKRVDLQPTFCGAGWGPPGGDHFYVTRGVIP